MTPAAVKIRNKLETSKSLLLCSECYTFLAKMRKLILCILISLIFISISGFSKAPSDQYTARVERVVDGDTIKLANGEKVRYIGIDTPETKHPKKPVQYMGEEASEANRKLGEGKTVRLEFDVQKRDKYGRMLAYVYVDDIFVNAWLVENGFAQVSTYPPNVKHQELFLKLQREARENKRGLWK